MGSDLPAAGATVDATTAKGVMMTVYMIADITIEDRKTYAAYVAQVPEVIERYGGRYVARCEQVYALTGGWVPERVIIVAFDSMEHLRACFNSPEYRALAPLRERSTTSRAIVVEGCDVDLQSGL
jgi:uncharacterized protein (DUF1330 family)